MIVKDYRDNEALRKSFNKLAGTTFGLDFEDWYQRGFWGANYNPYSVVMDNMVVANVSVNRTDFLWNDERKRFVQLGTVMTEAAYRHNGYIRQIMEEIERDYGEDCDGMYLFANDSVLEFYPKFGFQKAKEYQYTRKTAITGDRYVVQVPMQERTGWRMLETAIEKSVPYGRFELVGNSGLILFYITGFMQEDVYYIKKYDTYVIAEIEGSTLLIHNIFSPKRVALEDIIAAFGREIKQVVFGFTPLDAQDCTVCEYKEEDCTLFLKGKGFQGFARDQLMVPTLAHA